MPNGRWLAAAPVIAAAAVQVAPAATWLPAVRRVLTPRLAGRGARGGVALTFDDGPHPEATPAVLDVLDRLGWSATFFVLGSQVRRYPAVAAEVVAAGHELALHGDEHRYLIARGPRAARDDLHRAHDTVAALTGQPPLWWRPPYGVLSGPALAAARGLGVRPVLWSAWGRDWRAAATGPSVVADLWRGDVDGGVLLLHDSDVTSDPGAWRSTVAALPLLAERLDAAGVRVRTVGEHVRG
ncbi:MAG: polysaccharide deacetylase family protein [Frankiaceae bacterium]|nr:polysaccharide deacetylase family protein [Frankiaceae bacterium]MBV9368757.1 polysaccharide deacetylase family protein [Frankiales bacterium]